MPHPVPVPWWSVTAVQVSPLIGSARNATIIFMALFRGRLLLSAFATLPSQFSLSGRRCVSRLVATDPEGRKHSLVDISVTSTTTAVRPPDERFASICSAVDTLRDLASEIADRVCFLSFAPVATNIVSVAPPQVAVGDNFQVAVFVALPPRSSVQLEADLLGAFDGAASDVGQQALRLFRKGVSETNECSALAHLFMAAEVLTSSHCDAAESGSRIEAMFAKVDPKADFAATRNVRNEIITGRLQDMRTEREAHKRSGQLQSVVAAMLSEELGMRLATGKSSRVTPPLLITELAADSAMSDESKSLIVSSLPAHSAIFSSGSLVMLSEPYAPEDLSSIPLSGISLPVAIPNIAFPEVVR